MSLNTTQAIYEEFRTATREHLMNHLHHDVDWKRFQGIEEQAQQRIAQEKDAWQQNYHARLAEARQIILREAHGNILEPPKLDGVKAVPDREALDVKADQRIRQDHERRLVVIKKDELDQYQDLRDALRARDTLKGYAVQEFDPVRGQARSGPSQS